MGNTELLFFAFVIAFLFSIGTTPLVTKLAYKIGAVDVPKDGRRMHKKPTPRLGGLAIIFGFLVAVLCFGEMTPQLGATLLGAGVIAALGVIDDCKNLNAKLKFVVQIAAALVVVLYGNIRIEVLTNPNIFSENPYLILPDWLSVIVSVLWIVFITNAVNLIDGLDGLAAGVSAIMSVSLVFISVRVGEYPIAVIGMALMGGCFGFLPYNFNPAKIFMGDTGALFLGFILASVSIQGVFKSYAVISFAVPLLILGLPLFDASFAILRRLFTGKGIMTADRGHLHHRLIDMGFSQKQTVFILYAISGVLGITAVVLAESGALRALLLLVCVLILLFVTSFFGNDIFGNPSNTHKHNESADETVDIKKSAGESADKEGDTTNEKN